MEFNTPKDLIIKIIKRRIDDIERGRFDNFEKDSEMKLEMKNAYELYNQMNHIFYGKKFTLKNQNEKCTIITLNGLTETYTYKSAGAILLQEIRSILENYHLSIGGMHDLLRNKYGTIEDKYAKAYDLEGTIDILSDKRFNKHAIKSQFKELYGKDIPHMLAFLKDCKIFEYDIRNHKYIKKHQFGFTALEFYTYIMLKMEGVSQTIDEIIKKDFQTFVNNYEEENGPYHIEIKREEVEKMLNKSKKESYNKDILCKILTDEIK